MAYRFSKHYTRDEARALLPQIRQWLKQLTELQKTLDEQEQSLEELTAAGRDLGGTPVNQWVRNLAALKEVLMQFYGREIQIKDLERGLIDFPAVIGGKEVFLCWENGEHDVEFWHDLEAGYAGRERL